MVKILISLLFISVNINWYIFILERFVIIFIVEDGVNGIISKMKIGLKLCLLIYFIICLICLWFEIKCKKWVWLNFCVNKNMYKLLVIVVVIEIKKLLSSLYVFMFIIMKIINGKNGKNVLIKGKRKVKSGFKFWYLFS